VTNSAIPIHKYKCTGEANRGKIYKGLLVIFGGILFDCGSCGNKTKFYAIWSFHWKSNSKIFRNRVDLWTVKSLSTYFYVQRKQSLINKYNKCLWDGKAVEDVTYTHTTLLSHILVYNLLKGKKTVQLAMRIEIKDLNWIKLIFSLSMFL
jgi:hypothetical protein